MIGIIPAAGAGQRIQPIGCSKELLPVGSRLIDGVERPKAVSEYLVERMIAAGAEQICMIISPEKSDIIRYYAERSYAAEIFYVVQQTPRGLCDALFRAEPFAERHDQVLIGLPDTVWFPENAYLTGLGPQRGVVNLILFPVEDPANFDAVVCDPQNFVRRVEGKVPDPESHWIWGAITASSAAFRILKTVVGGASPGRRVSGISAECLHRRRTRSSRPPYRRNLYGCRNHARLSPGTRLPAKAASPAGC